MLGTDNLIGKKLVDCLSDGKTEITKAEIKKRIQIKFRYLDQNQAGRTLKRKGNGKGFNSNRLNICYDTDGVIKHIFVG